MFIVLLRTIWLAVAVVAALGAMVWQAVAGHWAVGLVFASLIMQLGKLHGPTPGEWAELHDFLDHLAQRKARK